ncbi:MAG: hypothetical protein FWF23_05415 [Alphaproteobacteria bacterium]|nr:hypothetical protein [Alphaproteobacteria bacterium]MCL2505184.1 hypothetical protein [Alphaproteobacteria bacterium]
MSVRTHIPYVCLALFAVSYAGTAFASLPEVRAAALQNNCPPQKIEVISNSIGYGIPTVYRVECITPKTTASNQANSITIRCYQQLCVFAKRTQASRK